MDFEYLSLLVKEHSAGTREIYIADAAARIIVSSDEMRVGRVGNTAKYVVSMMQTTSIQNNLNQKDAFLSYGVPIILKDQLQFVLVVKGEMEQIIATGNQLSQLIYANIAYETFLTNKQNKQTKSGHEEIAAQLLRADFDYEKMRSTMFQCELDPQLLRSFILIRLNFHQNLYFNINLSLGYEASIEQLREQVIKQVRSNKYLNAQDIVYAPERNMILILKSFLPTEDISKTYLAMDAVCKTLNTTLEKSNGFDFSIAYGDFYTDIRKLHQSFKEASDIITLSESAQTNHLQSIYGLFLEYTANRMSPLVINQIIKPLIQKLSLENGEFGKTLLYTMEIYVDSCMNLSYCANALGIHRNTVNARVLKFQEITSLSPSTHFKDAFIVKMTALYLKQNEYASRTQDEIGR